MRVNVNATVVGSIPTLRFELLFMKSLRSGNKVKKRGIELRHSTRNASKISQKAGNGVLQH